MQFWILMFELPNKNDVNQSQPNHHVAAILYVIVLLDWFEAAFKNPNIWEVYFLIIESKIQKEF